jgi:HEPN domain-containing protein
MNEETKNYIRLWIAKAADDLIVIDKLTQFEIVATSAVCFHCQQVVEKYLKAFLIAQGVEIRKTHNIEFLLAECEEFDAEFSSIDPKDLNDFGVDIRYPGDIYSPTAKETLAHKQVALEVKELVERKLENLI